MVYSATLRTIRSFLLLLIVGVAATANSSAQEGKKYAHEFYHDFRGKPLPKELHIAGKHDPSFIKQEPQGFRITLPKSFMHEFGGVGFRTNFLIQGDFEFTGAFEILHAETPPRGFGVGATLRAQKKPDPSQAGATLARMVRKDGKQLLIWDHTPEQGGAAARNEGMQLCTDKVLRLRLLRTGSTMHYLWSPGTEGENFLELHAEEFGDDDIAAVRMNVQTGRVRCEVDVRFLDFRVRSGGVANAQAPVVAAVAPPPNNLKAQPAAVPRDQGWLIATLLGGLGVTVLLFLGIGAVLYRSRRRADGAPAKAAAVESSFHVFPCPACGKSLKVKTALVGKKIKCPKCGETASIPPIAVPTD